MRRRELLKCVCFLVPCLLAAAAGAELQVASRPARPFVETRAGEQFVNFDLIVTNTGAQPLTLVAIKLKVFDHSGRLEVERELNENGHPPALDVVGERLLYPGKTIDVFQPFVQFGPEVELTRMHFDLLFVQTGRAASPIVLMPDASVSADEQPSSYAPAAYRLPLRGPVLVHDGHDFFSHHRRFSLVPRFESDPLTAVSANLYAYDFVKTTEAGDLWVRNPARKENWLTYGAPIFAPAAGLVTEVETTLPENTFSTAGQSQQPASETTRDPMGFGNHVAIRHSDGRVSWLMHMQPNSVAVRAGQRVEEGQFLGRVGFSGDSLFPHLHYTVTDSASYPSQGVPSDFSNIVRLLGSRCIPEHRAQIDTGDRVEDFGGTHGAKRNAGR